MLSSFTSLTSFSLTDTLSTIMIFAVCALPAQWIITLMSRCQSNMVVKLTSLRRCHVNIKSTKSSSSSSNNNDKQTNKQTSTGSIWSRSQAKWYLCQFLNNLHLIIGARNSKNTRCDDKINNVNKLQKNEREGKCVTNSIAYFQNQWRGIYLNAETWFVCRWS